MIRHVIALVLLLECTISISAQTTLFGRRNYQKPYEKGTRSWDGKPGNNYWQNRSQYTISARIDPKTRRLSGEETITYFNNSPDSLTMLRLKLQHDRYRKGAARAQDVTPSDIEDEGTRIESITF